MNCSTEPLSDEARFYLQKAMGDIKVSAFCDLSADSTVSEEIETERTILNCPRNGMLPLNL